MIISMTKLTLGSQRSIFLLFTLVSFVRPAQSQSLSWITNADNGTFTVTGFRTGESTGNLIIPGQINGTSVTAIGAYAFNGDLGLTNVVIPGSVVSIGFQAFEGCFNLATVTLSNGVQTIADDTFYATQLSRVTVPDSVTSIGTAAFDTSTLLDITVSPGNASYTSLDGVLFNASRTVLLQYPWARADGSYTVPPGVQEIGPAAMGAPNLTNVTLPASLLNIADAAFEQESSGTGPMSIMIPVGVTNIGSHAFYGTHLREVSIPAGVMKIGDAAFLNCTALTAINVDPQNANYSGIDGVLFDKQQSLLVQYPPARKASVYTLPSSVSIIGTTAFASSPGLTTIVAANRVANVQDAAFYRCGNLQNIYFAGDLPATGSGIFNFAGNLTVWYLPSSSGWGSELAGRPAAPFTFLSTAAARDSSGQFSFDILGSDGSAVVIETTAELKQPLSWFQIRTVKLTNGLFQYIESTPPGQSRFLRARIP